MTEEERWPVFAGEKAGAKDGIRPFFRENLHHFEEIEWVVLKIRVMNDCQFRVGVGQGGMNCRCFSLVGVMPEKEPFQPAGGPFSQRELKRTQDCLCLVGRTVVYDNDLDAV